MKRDLSRRKLELPGAVNAIGTVDLSSGGPDVTGPVTVWSVLGTGATVVRIHRSSERNVTSPSKFDVSTALYRLSVCERIRVVVGFVGFSRLSRCIVNMGRDWNA